MTIGHTVTGNALASDKLNLIARFAYILYINVKSSSNLLDDLSFIDSVIPTVITILRNDFTGRVFKENLIEKRRFCNHIEHASVQQNEPRSTREG